MDAVLNIPVLWLLPIALPVAAACALLVPQWRPASESLAPWSALPALLWALAPEAAGSVDVPWLLLGCRLGLDATSRVFLFFTAVLWLTSGLYALGYLAKDSRRHLFLFFFLLAMSGNLGLLLAQDMALFYLCFALMSFASYGLVVHNRDDAALYAGRVYIVLVIVGELLLFSGLVVAAFGTGSSLWNGLGDRLVGAPMGTAAMLLLFLGLAVKAGALPVHVWLPLAHPAAPVPASAVLSGAMIKAGLIGWLRLVPSEVATELPGWSQLCLLLGLAAAFYGVVIGLAQRNPKTILAYSSISQMGLMTVGLGLALSHPGPPGDSLAPTLMYAMHHGLAKGALFLGVGVAAASSATAVRRWLVGLGLSLPALALAGLPFTSGALAKATLKSELSAAPGQWPERLALLLPLAAVGTTLLVARFLWIAWPRPVSSPRSAAPSVSRSWGVLLAIVALAPLLWAWSAETSALKVMVDPDKILAALGPVLVGALLAAVAALAASRGIRLPAPAVPAGDVLEPVVVTYGRLRRGGVLLVRRFGAHFLRARFLAPPGVPQGPVPAGFALDTERMLRRSSVFGVLLLLIAGILIGLLALSG